MTSPEYAAVPLDEAANAPLDLLPEATRPAGVGELPLHGLPFALGPEVGRCLVHLGDGGAGEVEVTLGLTAPHLVFAHRLLSTRIPRGEPPGGPVAELVFTYDDGGRATHVVRERFEVAALPTGWGQLPFLALPDQADHVARIRLVDGFTLATEKLVRTGKAHLFAGARVDDIHVTLELA